MGRDSRDVLLLIALAAVAALTGTDAFSTESKSMILFKREIYLEEK